MSDPIEAIPAPAADASAPMDETTPLLAKDAPKEGDGLRKRSRKKSVAKILVNAAADYLPENMRGYAQKVGPVLDALSDAWVVAQPYYAQAKEMGMKAYKVLEPYHPEEWGPIIFGLILCFFGGCYATLISAITAFRLTSYDSVKECVMILYKDQKEVMAAWEKDNKTDADNNGEADVDEMDEDEFAKHKFLLVLKTVNPDELGKAISGINTGLLAVLAALRVQLAQAITMGAAMGGNMYNLLLVSVIPAVEAGTEPDFRKWVKPIFNYGTKFIGFALAMVVWRGIMSVYSAFRGSQLACTGLISYCVRHNYIEVQGDVRTSKEFAIISTVLAFFGILWQIKHGFQPPFPINLLLMPLGIGEWLLSTFVAF